MNIDAIIKMCDKALDYGSEEDIYDLIELFRDVLEQVDNFESSYVHDVMGKVKAFDNILDVLEEF